MLRPMRFFTMALSFLGLFIAVCLAGCPFATTPDYPPAILVSTTELDFGATETTLTFSVAKTWTSQTMPPFTVSPDAGWVSCTPTTGTSDGPDDAVLITVTIDRAAMDPGGDTATITVSAVGIVPRKVAVIATGDIAAGFTADKTAPLAGEVVTFTDTSWTVPAVGAIDTWAWTFGDGSPVDGTQHPAHAYANPGVYTVSLTVWAGALSATETKIGYITVPAPAADFTADTTFGEATLRVQFTDLSFGGKTVLSRQWNFGDGSPASAEANPAHDYTAAGSYDVTLTVTTEWGDYSETKAGYIQVADPGAAATGAVDLADAVVVTRSGDLPRSEVMAPTVLIEEIQKRTGVALQQTTTWPTSGTAIAIMSREGQVTKSAGKIPESRWPEGYRMFVEQRSGGLKVVWILGADGRGALYGVGKLLRLLSWTSAGQVTLDAAPNLDTAPDEAIRGHEMGYRNTSNTYDAWNVADYEQYIRECIIFGANAVQNIPFDETASPHFPVSQTVMNVAMSDICYRYGIEFWVWTPVNMNSSTERVQALTDFDAMYAACPRLDGVFLPAGDPGHNPPDVMMPFAEDVAALLATHHPGAGVWLGNETLTHGELDDFFDYLQTQQPAWLRGVVYGPWTKITLSETRTRTPGQYLLRRYPDITHSIECQYPVEHRDRALAYTLGRENPNPRPTGTAHIHDVFSGFSNGFISYSDGINDDVNKHIWTLCGWDATMPVADMLLEYARFFFGPALAATAADGIAGLEQNEVGPLAASASVDDTFVLWQGVEASKSDKALADTNWRWQLCLLRAYYDTYIKERVVYETQLETNANAILANAATLGADTAMAQAAAELAKATTQPVRPDLKTRIQELCEDLFNSIGLQSSVALYGAANWERGAILDFADQAVNNRGWLESEFARIGALGTEGEKLTEIGTILNWENPGTGGFYDDLGNVGKQPHLVQQKTWAEDPGFVESTQDEFIEIVGRETWRLSWLDQAQTLYGQPLQMSYTGLNPAALYRLRVLYTGRFGSIMTLTANGTYTVHGSVARPDPPQVLSYDLPASVTSTGALNLEWTLDDGRGCQVAEVWLEVR